MMRRRLSEGLRAVITLAMLAGCAPQANAPTSRPDGTAESNNACTLIKPVMSAVDGQTVSLDPSAFTALEKAEVEENLKTVERQAAEAFPESKIEKPFYVVLADGCDTVTYEFANIDGVPTYLGVNIKKNGEEATFQASNQPLTLAIDSRYSKYSAGGQVIVEVDRVLRTTRVLDSYGNWVESSTPSISEYLSSIGVTSAGAAELNPTTMPIVRGTETATAKATAIDKTPTAPPPPEQQYTAEKISVIPMELTDIPKLVEVADPINNQAKFKADVAKIWAVIQKDILPTYPGPYFEAGGLASENNVDLMANHLTGALMIRQDIAPVSSFRYKVNGADAVGLVVLVRDKQKIFPMIIMTDPNRQNNINGKGNSRRDIASLLKTLKEGGKVIKTNEKYSTQLFYALPESTDRDFQTDFDKNFLKINKSKENIEEWLFKATPTDLNEFLDEIIYADWWQSEIDL